MFNGCYSLYELILSSSFNMENVVNYDDMFSNFYIDIIQNGANLKDNIKNSIIELKNFIYIVIYSEESKENLQFINFNEIENNIIMYQNDEKIDYKDNINVESGKTIIKLIFTENNKISCDDLFIFITEIKKIVFKNFDICNSANKMFYGCSLLEKLNLKSFITSEITNM